MKLKPGRNGAHDDSQRFVWVVRSWCLGLEFCPKAGMCTRSLTGMLIHGCMFLCEAIMEAKVIG